MIRTTCLVVAAASVAILPIAARQGPPPAGPTFRSAVDVVDVDVSVLDRHRLPVRGLTAADFTVLEDGRPRAITAFAEVSLPRRVAPTAAWLRDVAPDVQSNDLSREGRLVVLLMDRSIDDAHRGAAMAYAEAAIDELRPGDLAAVAYSALGVPQNFTADRDRLIAAIRQPTGPRATGDSGECYCGACSLESVAHIAESLLPVRQRRKLLFLVGSNVSMPSGGPCSGLLSAERERAVRALEAANVTVFTFDPSGLQTLVTGASASSPPRGRPAMANLVRRGNLEFLPERTGGRLILDPVDAANRVADVFRETDAYYVMGFQPVAGGAAGRFHQIRVNVARDGVRVQARRGYYAGGAAASKPRRARGPVDPMAEALARAVNGLWPQTDLRLSLATTTVAKPDLSSAVVEATVGVQEEHERDGLGPASVDEPVTVTVLTGAFDRRGQTLASARRTLAVRPRRAADGTFAYEVTNQLVLPPGHYELRTALTDDRAGRTGSVYADVDVPDFAHAPVAMSGLVLAPVADVPDTRVEGLVPIAPSTRRVFAPTDRVTAFVRVYQGLSRSVMPGYLTAEIHDADDRVVFNRESRVTPEQFGASRGTDVTIDMPVAELGRGEYLLTIDARFGNETAHRDARFRVQ